MSRAAAVAVAASRLVIILTAAAAAAAAPDAALADYFDIAERVWPDPESAAASERAGALGVRCEPGSWTNWRSAVGLSMGPNTPNFSVRSVAMRGDWGEGHAKVRKTDDRLHGIGDADH